MADNPVGSVHLPEQYEGQGCGQEQQSAGDDFGGPEAAHQLLATHCTNHHACRYRQEPKPRLQRGVPLYEL